MISFETFIYDLPREALEKNGWKFISYGDLIYVGCEKIINGKRVLGTYTASDKRLILNVNYIEEPVENEYLEDVIAVCNELQKLIVKQSSNKKELNTLETRIDRKIKDIKACLKYIESDEERKDFSLNDELQICYLAKKALKQDKASNMASIKTLNKIKHKLTPDEYNTLANDLSLLAKLWYAVSCEDENYFYIDKTRDDGSIAKFLQRRHKHD